MIDEHISDLAKCLKLLVFVAYLHHLYDMDDKVFWSAALRLVVCNPAHSLGHQQGLMIELAEL